LRVNDAVSGALFILLAVALISISSTFPALPGQPYGAALFPTVIGAGFAICGVLLVVRGLSTAGRKQAAFALDPDLRDPRNAISLLMVVGAVVLYIVLADWVGFIPIAFVLLLGMFLWLGARVLPALVTAALFTGATFWFFANILRVPLPRGLLTGII
jgi:putative tricarboxylic transport membrane protein